MPKKKSFDVIQKFETNKKSQYIFKIYSKKKKTTII